MPGPYAQAPGPYAQPPGQPYPQPTGQPYPQQPGQPYPQPPGPYAHVAAAPPYPQAQGPYQGVPGQAAYPVPPSPYGVGQGACQVCGAAPAGAVTVRGHQGMIVFMRMLRRKGVFCRPCGLAMFRDMQANTLIAGWWGPMSALITPVVLLLNLGALSRIKKLPEPVTPGPRPPLDPGRPVFRRPQGVLALIPLGLLALLVLAVPLLMIIGAASDTGRPRPLTAGSCVHNDGTVTDQDLSAVPCDSAEAQYRLLYQSGDKCRPGDYLADPEYSADGVTVLCLRPLDATDE
ncbi:hypothetical protein [Streptomyces sp. NPDC005435]|uniref:LppU/SCO3897 family protein n=1 Tax=Streptomyces sp. NPDC005435 TaxID=3154464 RepID=UPI0034567C35